MPSSAPLAAPHRDAQIAQARQALLVQGGLSTRAEVAPWIARSWQRCLEQGRRPGERVVFDAVSAPALRRSRERNHQLLRAARPVLAQLIHALAGMRYFALLTDAAGIVVDVQGDCDRHDPRCSAIGRVGVDLSEAAVGTTAIGAALTEQHAVWLHRGEHFFDDNGSYSCAGAPLFGPHGQCIGMLDLTGVHVPERPELRHLVARSARAMEDALLRQVPHALLLRLNWPGCTLGGEEDGLLALDSEGFVVGANRTARQLVPQPLAHQGQPVHASDLLAMPWVALFDAARRHPPPVLDLPLWSGLRLQAWALLADDARGSGTASAPLREAEAALIRRAVQDARGNVAQAARALGISRATVYRKLGQPKGA